MSPRKNTTNLPIDFGNLSIGDRTASLGFKLSREVFSLDDADHFLCGRRLTGSIIVQPNRDHPDQEYFEGMDQKYLVEASFDIKSIRVTPKQLGGNLTFPLGEVNVSDLAHFAKRTGTLKIKGVEDLAAIKQADEEEEEEEGEPEE